MKKKPGIIGSTKVKMLSLRLTPEHKAALQAFADAGFEGNISDAARDIIIAVACERHVLIFQHQLVAIALHLNRLCHMLREESGRPEFSELLGILERLEHIQASLHAFAKA